MRRLIALLALCVAGLAFSNPPVPSAAKVSEPQQPHTTEGADTASDKAKNADKPALVVNNIYASPVAKAHSEQTAEKANEESPYKGVWDATIALSTAILAVITGVLALFTFRLWQGAEITAKRQLRAYLGIGKHAINVIKRGPNDTFAQAEIEIKNTGQTPAHRAIQTIKMEIKDAGHVQSFPAQITDRGPTVIVPGSEITIRFDLDADEPILRALASGAKTAFVWGSVSYLDIFDKPQHLEFRYKTVGRVFETDKTTTFLVGLALAPEEQGNTST